MHRRVRADGADSHNPGLGIDPLERGSAQVADRFALALLTVRDRPGMGDFPRQIQQIRRADVTQHGVEHRVSLEHRAQSETDRHHQYEEAAGNAEHMGDRAVKAEVHAGCQQHRVVRAGRDRGDKGKQGEAQQQIE
ncbi:hypothetical protein D3C87_1411090 [compost metagenome]